MFFSRLTLKPEVGQIQLLRKMSRNKYQLHQLLWNLFTGESTRKDSKNKALADFVYRADYPEKQLIIHLVSSRSPTNKDGIWDIESKPYTPDVQANQRLQFYLRVNPTITVYGRAKHERHDALMHAKKKMTEASKQQGQEAERYELWQAMQNMAQTWLLKREQHIGAKIMTEHLSADNYRQERIVAQNQDDPIQFSTVDFEGILTVTDPEQFKSALFSGIGKAKAFGCGLLLVRRI